MLSLNLRWLSNGEFCMEHESWNLNVLVAFTHAHVYAAAKNGIEPVDHAILLQRSKLRSHRVQL
jgi:hypothetical protein